MGIGLVIGFCSYLASLGEAVVSGTVASTVLIGLAYVFVSGRHPKINTVEESKPIINPIP
jgi:predicted nucleic acid-binding Zn finger protein